MNWSAFAAVSLLAVSPALASAEDVKDITLRGCVVRGIDKDTFALNSVSEVTKNGLSTIPSASQGHRVIFWFNKDDKFKDHVGELIEVKGEMGEIKESEIELKAGKQKDGGLVAEFEGPGGKDVKVSNDVIGSEIGTAGRTEADNGKKDLKAFLIKVDVDEVKRISNCSR
jgi:hypothetical protein